MKHNNLSTPLPCLLLDVGRYFICELVAGDFVAVHRNGPQEDFFSAPYDEVLKLCRKLEERDSVADWVAVHT
jgi:hypothetical protein